MIKYLTTSSGKLINSSSNKFVTKSAFPATYPSIYSAPLTVELPSGDLLDIEYNQYDEFLHFSADFKLAIAFDGTHWGSYACYGGAIPVYIYKLPDDYIELDILNTGNGITEARNLAYYLDPIGAIYKLDDGIIMVTDPGKGGVYF